MPKRSGLISFTYFITLFTENQLLQGSWDNIFTAKYKFSVMDTNENINNSVFTFAFTGVLLFISAIGFEIGGVLTSLAFQVPFTIIGLILGGLSMSLVYKAIKYDRYRLKRA